MKNITSKEEHMKWLDEEERWSPINPYLDIENCYEVSSYGRIRNTRYNKILDDIHNSTNGFDYIFIATKEHKPSYQHIDVIVCMTFWAWNVNNLPLHEPIIPSHIDGDTRNNRASNLEFIIDKEIWKPIIGYKDIIDGMYEASNHGNIRNIIKGFQCQINHNPLYYPKCGFMTSNGKKAYDVHRIIASLFCQCGAERFNIINHIDNNCNNNHWRNIEWCDQSWNTEHSKSYSPQNEKLTIDVLDKIRELICIHRAPRKISEITGFPEELISAIKRGKCTHRSFRFTQEELCNLMDNYRLQYDPSSDEVHSICKLLLAHDGNTDSVFTEMQSINDKITLNNIIDIKYKRARKNISDIYFDKNKFIK